MTQELVLVRPQISRECTHYAAFNCCANRQLGPQRLQYVIIIQVNTLVRSTDSEACLQTSDNKSYTSVLQSLALISE